MPRHSLPRRLAAAGCALLLAAAAAGCRSPAASHGDASGAAGETAARTFADPVLNVAIFEGAQGKDYWLAVKRRFEADYPGVTVNLEASPKIMDILKPQIIAGNPPDFLYVPPEEATGLLQAMMRDKRLLDLTDVFEGPAPDAAGPLKDKLADGILEYAKPTGDGKLYYAPAYLTTLGLIYNKTLFAQKGWKVPRTWAEFLALGAAAKQDGRYLFTYQGTDAKYNESLFWSSIASEAGPEALVKLKNYEPDAFRQPAVTRTMNLFAEMAAKGYILPGTAAMNHTQAESAFLAGKALFIPCGSWIETEMKDVPREAGFAFGFAAPPVFDEGDQPYAQTALYDFYIPAKAKNIELAKEFLRYQYRDDIVQLNAQMSQSMMAVKNGAELARPYVSDFVYRSASIFAAGVKPLIFQWKTTPTSTTYINSQLWDPLGSVVGGQMTVAQWQDRVENATAKLRDLLAGAGAHPIS